MKKILSSFLTMLATGVLLSACEQCKNPTITEPTVDEYAWLTHERGDVLIFRNEKGERVKYSVTNKAKQNVIPAGAAMDNCVDNLNTQAIVLLEDSTNLLPDLATFIFKTPNTFNIKVAVFERGDWEIDQATPTYPTKEINGITYTNVFELKPVPTANNGVKHILYNKEHGFLYLEYKDGTFITRVS